MRATYDHQVRVGGIAAWSPRMPRRGEEGSRFRRVCPPFVALLSVGPVRVARRLAQLALRHARPEQEGLQHLPVQVYLDGLHLGAPRRQLCARCVSRRTPFGGSGGVEPPAAAWHPLRGAARRALVLAACYERTSRASNWRGGASQRATGRRGVTALVRARRRVAPASPVRCVDPRARRARPNY